MESSEILILQDKVKKEIESIKGLSGYSKPNQITLLKQWDKKNIEAYIKIDNALRKRKFYQAVYRNSDTIYFGQPWGFAVGLDGDKYQMTDHTLFTFLQEHNILPTQCKQYKRSKKEH